MKRINSKVLPVAAFVVLLSFPFLLNRYFIYVLNVMGIFTILALGLNLVMGYAGQISIGHAGFVAIGAYTTGLLKVKLGVPFWVGWPAGALFASMVGFALGLPALRLRGHYLALVTIGFGISVQLIIFRWESLTYGARGFNVDPVSIFSFRIASGQQVYYLIILTVIFMTILAKNIVNSKTGRAFLAVRDSEIASQSMGIDLAQYKTLAFALSAFYAGTAGGLYVALMRYVSADNFGIWDSVLYVTMIVIGGMASIPGSVVGVVLVVLTQELLREFREFQGLLFGIAVVIFIILMPNGVYGIFSGLRNRIGSVWRK